MFNKSIIFLALNYNACKDLIFWGIFFKLHFVFIMVKYNYHFGLSCFINLVKPELSPDSTYLL